MRRILFIRGVLGTSLLLCAVSFGYGFGRAGRALSWARAPGLRYGGGVWLPASFACTGVLERLLATRCVDVEGDRIVRSARW